MRQVPPPNLKIIDQAIKRIKSKINKYSCSALSNSLDITYKGSSFNELRNIYVKQYLLVTKKLNGGKLPSWWDQEETPKRQLKRVEALIAFKQACINAAKNKR